MEALTEERYRMTDVSHRVTVPANPKARLMYYFDCVATVIQLDNPDLGRLRNYGRFDLLTDAEFDTLLALVLLFSPDELRGKVFFPSEDCGGLTNQFFELSAATLMLAVAENVLIRGESKRVSKIMFFKRRWMEDNYILPLRSFTSHLERLASGLPGGAQPPPHPQPHPNPSTTSWCIVM